MLFDLIATIVVGVGVSGIVIGINKLSGSRFPKWLTPMCVGLSMIGFTIFNEYAWFRNTELNLPEDTVVAQKIEESKFYRPWTYIWPQTSRFIALSDIQTISADTVSAGIILVTRWQNALEIPAVFDCAGARRADFPLGLPQDVQAALPNAEWIALSADDPLLTTACRT